MGDDGVFAEGADVAGGLVGEDQIRHGPIPVARWLVFVGIHQGSGFVLALHLAHASIHVVSHADAHPIGDAALRATKAAEDVVGGGEVEATMVRGVIAVHHDRGDGHREDLHNGEGH